MKIDKKSFWKLDIMAKIEGKRLTKSRLTAGLGRAIIHDNRRPPGALSFVYAIREGCTVHGKRRAAGYALMRGQFKLNQKIRRVYDEKSDEANVTACFVHDSVDFRDSGDCFCGTGGARRRVRAGAVGLGRSLRMGVG